MQEELSQLQKVLEENPNQGRIARDILQDRIARTLARLAILEKIELRRLRRKSRRERIIEIVRVPSKRIRRTLAHPGPRNIADLVKSQYHTYLRWRTAKSLGAQIPSSGSIRGTSLTKTYQRQGLFERDKKLRLQTLNEKYGNMTWGADLMVGILEDIGRLTPEDLQDIRTSRPKICKTRRSRKDARRETRTQWRAVLERFTLLHPTVTPSPTSQIDAPSLGGGFWKSMKDFLGFGL